MTWLEVRAVSGNSFAVLFTIVGLSTAEILEPELGCKCSLDGSRGVAIFGDDTADFDSVLVFLFVIDEGMAVDSPSAYEVSNPSQGRPAADNCCAAELTTVTGSGWCSLEMPFPSTVLLECCSTEAAAGALLFNGKVRESDACGAAAAGSRVCPLESV